jgi:hypothetical protein
MTAGQPRDAQCAAARRAAARVLHPDRGGDPAAFVAALTAIDAAYGPQGRQSISVIVRHPRLRWFITTMRRVIRRVVPGTRHYARL